MTSQVVATLPRPTEPGRNPSLRKGAARAAIAATGGLLTTWWLVATQTWVGRLDTAVLQDAASDRTGWLTPLVLRFTDLAGTTLLPVLVALTAAVLVGVRRFRAAVALTAALMVSAGIGWAMKTVVARPRPVAALMAGPVEHGFAFPSGHTTAATAVLLVGAGLLVRRVGRPLVRFGAWSAASLGVVAVAASRVYLGYHWPTDVVAGTFLGAAVAALVLLVVRWGPARADRGALGPVGAAGRTRWGAGAGPQRSAASG